LVFASAELGENVAKYYDEDFELFKDIGGLDKIKDIVDIADTLTEGFSDLMKAADQEGTLQAIDGGRAFQKILGGLADVADQAGLSLVSKVISASSDVLGKGLDLVGERACMYDLYAYIGDPRAEELIQMVENGELSYEDAVRLFYGAEVAVPTDPLVIDLNGDGDTSNYTGTATGGTFGGTNTDSEGAAEAGGANIVEGYK